MAQKRRKSSTSRKKNNPAGAKKKASQAPRGRTAVEDKAQIRLEIVSIALMACGAFLIFALFSEASGKVGAAFGAWLSGLFGPMANALPFFLITYGGLLIIGFVHGLRLERVVTIAIIFVLLCIMLAGRYIEVVEGVAMIKGGETSVVVYARSVAGEGGGLLGTYIAKAMIGWLGVAGLYIFCTALIIVSSILLAGMSMSKAAGAVREKKKARRKEREKRRAEYSEPVEDEYEEKEKHNNYKYEGDFEEEDGGRQDKFQMPSFLDSAGQRNGAGNTGSGGGNKSGKKSPDKRDNIIDAVKNDETYGDFSKGRGLEIEDTTTAETPEKDPEPEDPLLAGEPQRRRPKPVSPVVISEAGLGKKPSGAMGFGVSADDSNYRLPPIDLLSARRGKARGASQTELKATAAKLEQVLRDFRVDARVDKITVGPTVTRYEVEPDAGVKIQSIRSLEQDIALKLEVTSVRVVSMPGQSVIGIEAYNANTSVVTLRDIIDSEEFEKAPGKVSFALGKNVSGARIIVDLKDMPHLLIAGTTGSGKSVCINSILLSVLYRAKPSEVKMILIDPKIMELKPYADLPHLLLPVVTDPERAAKALSYAVSIMTDRNKKIEEQNVRNLDNFNEKMRRAGRPGEVMPQIVIVIDELQDLMQIAPAKVQESISRLAAMGRAAGLHLIVATQNPLASVLTSIIKNNIPSRIALVVPSNSASRVILDMPGAERLSGKGDMLFKPLGASAPIRVQGAFVGDPEVEKVVNYVKRQMNADYSAEIMSQVDAVSGGNLTEDEDELFIEAVDMIAQTKQASVSMLQRRFRIGYNRAARLVDMMEERGIVAASDGTNKPRRLIMTEAQLKNFLDEAGQDDFGPYEGMGANSGPYTATATEIDSITVTETQTQTERQADHGFSFDDLEAFDKQDDF